MKGFHFYKVGIIEYIGKFFNKNRESIEPIIPEDKQEPEGTNETEISAISKDMFTKKEVSFILEGLKAINANKRKAYKEMNGSGLDKKYLRTLGRDIYAIQQLIDRIKETCLSNSEQ